MIITRENVDALLEGFAILGTGGGGSARWGRAILLHDLEMGRQVNLVDPQDVPDDAVVASGGMMGSVKYLDKMDPLDLVRRWDEKFELAEAFQLQEQAIGKAINHVIAFEMGGLNTPIILSLGARTGRTIIDGDGLGRAAPETQMVSFIGYNISLTPMPLVDVAGNKVVVFHGVENTYADMLGRWVITRGGGLGANCHYPMSGAQLKQCVIPNTISKALALGEAVQAARKSGKNPVETVAQAVGGKHVHTGIIKSLEESEWEGFYFTKARIDEHIEIIIKNETMAMFIDGNPVCIFPDFILILDPVTGAGLMSADLKVGQKISVVVHPCHPRLRKAMESDAARTAFSPTRYGQPDLVYQPVEKLLF